MKKGAAILCLLVLLLTGCADKDRDMEKAITLRSKMLQSGVAFTASVTADYGDRQYHFAMECEADPKGNLTFRVKEPETLEGISGKISEAGGKLTFDDHALAFDPMAGGQLSPVTGPWILVKTLQGGYLSSCAKEGERLRLAVDDSYRDDALHLDIWLDDAEIPEKSEIFWQGRRLLSIEVEDFRFL